MSVKLFATRVIITLVIVFLYFKSAGQNFTGKYQDYFGHSLEINNDSTFRLEWKFDLIKTWSIGKWKISHDTIYLEFIDVYDTLSRIDKPDSLVKSLDEIPNRINEDEYAGNLISSGGQKSDDITQKLLIKGKRLFLV